jgi:PAS domain S-box-containing protein
MVERVPAVVYVDASDEVSSAIYMSPRAEAMLGYAPEEWLDDPGMWMGLLHEEDRERVLAEQERTRQTGEPFAAEYRLMAKDGRAVWVRDEAVLVEESVEGRPVWYGLLVDVTDKRRAGEALRESEERFRLVARATNDVIWDLDLKTDEQEWDGAVEAAFGYPRERVIGAMAWWEERVHPDDRGRVLRGLGAVLRPGGGESWADGYRFRRADGSYAHVEDRGYVVRDAGTGEAVRMVGSMTDVTERAVAEAALRESEERFRTTFEAAAAGIAHLAPDGRWLRINGKLCEIAGCPREELLGMTYTDLTPAEDLEAGRERVRRLLEGKRASYTVEKRYVRKDGSRVWVSLYVSLVRDASGEPDYLVCVAKDITERKLSELVRYPLTGREMEVLRLLAEGLKNREIAGNLGYSVGMIKVHVERIFRKLGVHERKQAAARAVEIGLIPPPPY